MINRPYSVWSYKLYGDTLPIPQISILVTALTLSAYQVFRAAKSIARLKTFKVEAVDERIHDRNPASSTQDY